MAVPLTTGAEPMGALVLLESGKGDDSPEERVPFLTAAAHQVALALQNARLFTQEAHVSGVFQRALRPHPVAPPGLEVAVEWRPAPGEVELAGDFYDFFRLADGHWLIAIGDVCGHGVVAATYTAMAKYVLRSYAYESNSPAEILRRTNEALVAQMRSEDALDDAPAFITLLCALYHPDTGRVVYSHAGHPLGVVARGDGAPVPLDRGGPMLGLEAEASFEEGEVSLRPGDTLALYTDGVMEAARGPDVLEPEQIAALLSAHREEPVERALRAVLDEVSRISGGKQYDDLTLVVLRARE